MAVEDDFDLQRCGEARQRLGCVLLQLYALLLVDILPHPTGHLGREVVGDNEFIEAIELLAKVRQAWVAVGRHVTLVVRQEANAHVSDQVSCAQDAQRPETRARRLGRDQAG